MKHVLVALSIVLLIGVWVTAFKDAKRKANVNGRRGGGPFVI